MKENTSLRERKKHLLQREGGGGETRKKVGCIHKTATPRSPCYDSLIASERKQLPFFSQPELGSCSGSITTYLYDLEEFS